MILGIVSDSHDEIGPIIEAIVEISSYKAEYFIHLGDFYTDCDKVSFPNMLKLLRVPGLYSEQYKDSSIPNRLILSLGGKKLLLTHSLQATEHDLETDPIPDEIIKNDKPDIVLYGHTHIPDIHEKDGIIYFNPGHLIYRDNRGFPPTYGIIDTEKNKYMIMTLRDGGLLKEWP